MILDPQVVSPGAMYHFLTGAVVPRPIAFVSTVGRGGLFNVAPFSYFNVLTNRPPLVGISINRRGETPKDTLRNIQETGDFVVNIVDEALSARAVEASGDWPEEVDEFAIAGLTPLASDLVRSPRVGESSINLECKVHRIIELGHTHFIVGEIVRAHVRDDVLTDGRVDVAKLKPVGRLGGDGYSVVREVLHLPRPRVERGAGPA